MVTRFLTAVVALLILTPFLVFSQTPMLEIFIVVLSTLAIYEMLSCIGLAKKPAVAFPAYIISIGLPCFARHMESADEYVSLLFLFLFIYMFYLLTLSVFSKGTILLNDAAVAVVATIYIIFSFSCILLLRDLKYGQYIFLLVFVSAWMTDTGAYLIGITFGRHKLIENVSPKKTIEGAVGGIVFCVLSFGIYGFIVGLFFGVEPRYFQLIILGIIMSVISQCGDLIASLIKRRYGIKDYGTVFPGHGGVMDRFDSIIAVAAMMFIVFSSSSFFEIFH